MDSVEVIKLKQQRQSMIEIFDLAMNVLEKKIKLAGLKAYQRHIARINRHNGCKACLSRIEEEEEEEDEEL